MLHFNSCMKCGEQTGNGNYCQNCAPAQEEKEMKTPDRCAKCPSVLMQHEEVMCSRCRDKEDALTADLRERWDRAYYAALTGMCAAPDPHTSWDRFIEEAGNCANETIRRHAELMASRDAAIAEVVG